MSIGIIGCGLWGQNYVRVMTELAPDEKIAICDTDEKRLRIIQRRLSATERFTDYHELLAQTDLHAVVVATPGSTHYEIAKAALEAQKHVLVEKPFVLQEAHGQELVELAKRHNLVLMVGHTFLYNPAIRKLKQYMTNGPEGVGEVYYLTSTRTNLGPIRKDVNVVWDLAPHDVSILSYLLECSPIAVRAVGARKLRNTKEDVAFITLTYPKDIIANIHVSWLDPNRVRQIVVVGSNKRIIFDDLNPIEKIRVFEKAVSCSGVDSDSFGEFILSIRDGDIISPKVEGTEPLKNLCSEFLECIKRGTQPLADGHNGLEVVKVLIAAQLSLENDGEVLEIK